jgi:hypothetical protein
VRHVELFENQSSVFDLVERPMELLEIILGMADRFDVAFEVSQFRAQHSIDGRSVRKVIRFEHIDEEVDRGAIIKSNRLQDRVKGRSISLEDALDLVNVVALQIIDEDHIVESVGEKRSRGQADFLVPAGDFFAAADDLPLSFVRGYRPKLGRSASSDRKSFGRNCSSPFPVTNRAIRKKGHVDGFVIIRPSLAQ